MPTARSVSRRLPAGEVDGDGKQHEDHDREPDGQLADELDGRLDRPQLIRLHDHDAAGVRAETLLDLCLGQAYAVRQLLDERLQVEHNLTLCGLEELTLVVDDADEGLVRPPVRLLPQRLDGRAAEEIVGRAHGELAQATCDRRCERLHSRRQATPGARPPRRRSGTAGRRGRARERRGCRRPRAAGSSLPPIGRSRAPVASGPDRQRRHEADQPREHDQEPDGDPTPAGERRS